MGLLTSEILPALVKNMPERLVLSATGRSMIPTIVRGDRLYLRRSEGPVQTGQIVLARDREGRYFIHRVVSTEPLIKTQGDALPEPDDPIESVLAVLEKIEITWRSRFRRWTLKSEGYFKRLFPPGFRL